MSQAFQTLAVLQGAKAQYGTNYPLVAVVPAIRYLLGDFYLSYIDDNLAFQPPFYITQMTGFGGSAGRKDMVIKDSLGQTVLDTTTVTGSGLYVTNAWGVNVITLSWYGTTRTLRCTMRLAPPPWDPSVTWSNDITGLMAELDGRTYERQPRSVRSIIVGLQTFSAQSLVLAEGFNVSLTATTTTPVDGGRLVNQITIQANPGDGLGQVPGCPDTDVAITSINSVQPTANGDFFIDASGCYRLQRPAVVTNLNPRQVTIGSIDVNETTALASLQLFNDCGPCCSCEDFVNTYEGIRSIFNRYQSLGQQAESVRDQLQANINRWNAQKACRETQNLRLILQGEKNGVLFVGGFDCNTTTCCLVPLVLRTTLEYFRDGLPITNVMTFSNLCRESWRAGTDTQYAEVSYTPIINWPVLDTVFDYADPQAISRFRNRLQFPAEDSDTVRVTLSVHLPPVFNPVTGAECPLPDPTKVGVPASVLAIWASVPPLYPVRGFIQQVTPVSQTAGCCGGG